CVRDRRDAWNDARNRFDVW
nr:immunoglobulin heavy chain junction region [Macaca mulatta]MOW32188.1 immunoglobulin heavy chain junction region [Macaca mulatta]MOW32717.1 immunoglobulin heavy chain junction region [Macaca mulatta]MOW33301.1 immunoglobulin heavy chain junction region [Macaca mulatta]MOW33336.1 immunoglobulin heavy chain junction region [Macaca mulatta]